MLVRAPKGNPPPWRVFIFGLAIAAAGCNLNPQKLTPYHPLKDYTAFSCDDLAPEYARINGEYERLRYSNKPGTRDALRHLNGEAFEYNEAIRINGCPLRSVRIPGTAVAERNAGNGR